MDKCTRSSALYSAPINHRSSGISYDRSQQLPRSAPEITKERPDMEMDQITRDLDKIRISIISSLTQTYQHSPGADHGEGGHDDSSCLDPSQMIISTLDKIMHIWHQKRGQLHDWAERSRYFHRVTNPAITNLLARTHLPDQSLINKGRAILEACGDLDESYLRSFEQFGDEIQYVEDQVGCMIVILTSVIEETSSIDPNANSLLGIHAKSSAPRLHVFDHKFRENMASSDALVVWSARETTKSMADRKNRLALLNTFPRADTDSSSSSTALVRQRDNNFVSGKESIGQNHDHLRNLELSKAIVQQTTHLATPGARTNDHEVSNGKSIIDTLARQNQDLVARAQRLGLQETTPSGLANTSSAVVRSTKDLNSHPKTQPHREEKKLLKPQTRSLDQLAVGQKQSIHEAYSAMTGSKSRPLVRHAVRDHSTPETESFSSEDSADAKPLWLRYLITQGYDIKTIKVTCPDIETYICALNRLRVLEVLAEEMVDLCGSSRALAESAAQLHNIHVETLDRTAMVIGDESETQGTSHLFHDI